MPASSAADVYDGTIPFPDTGAGSLPIGGPAQVAVTSVIAVTPLAGLAVAIWLAWGHGVGVTDLLLMTVLYAVTGLGVTVGYHRYFTHRGFRATRSLRIALAVAGSMAFEGPSSPGSPLTAGITPSPTGPVTPTPRTVTGRASAGCCAAWPRPHGLDVPR
jgi:Fatty-acid desaturase